MSEVAPSDKMTVSRLEGVVMVVNDDRVQLTIWSELLKKAGLEVHACRSVEKALQEMESGCRPHLIMTDLHMPGIDGWRFCRLLRSPEYVQFNHTPILVSSSTFSGEDAHQITTELGANAFLPSPFAPGEFFGHVARLLKGEALKLASRVLIVEDDEIITDLLVRSFQAHGYLTAAAGNGQDALRLCQQQLPELVILDYHLPDTEGDVLLEKICRMSPNSAVIIMTGDPRPTLAVETMKRGARAYVRKPFDVKYLITVSEKARREISLLRVEDRLEERTQELRESEERYRTLVQGITDALLVFEVNPDGTLGRFLEVNDAACNRLGYAREELFQMSPAGLEPPENEGALFRALTPVVRGGAVVFEQTVLSKTGQRVPVEIHAQLFRLHGHPAVISVVRDITERKQAEEERRKLEVQIQQMQKLESLGIVAGGIAHDFNNILQTVLGNVDLVLDGVPPYAPYRDKLVEAKQSTLRAADLCMQMLAYAGRGQFIAKQVDLNELIHEMTPLLESSVSKKATLRCHFASGLPVIQADVTQLHQILMNLVINASEAMGTIGGDVIISTSTKVCDRAFLEGTWLKENLPEGLYVCLEVADTGCGMDAETLAKVFDPFFTTKFTGRGLGLAAVLGIVRGHKGAIDVTSEAGRGTTFRLFLPASGEIVPRVKKAMSASDPWRGSGALLLVDDDASLRAVVKSMLERLGFGVLVAEDGGRAVQIMREQGAKVRGIILDLTMPGMDGIETLAAIRELCPGMPVLMASGYSEEDLSYRFQGKSVEGFIQKPYGLNILRERLKAMFPSE